MIRFLLLDWIFALWLVCSVVQAKVIYVNGSNPSGGDGTSWATAHRYLQDALAQTVSGDEVWVAAGTYFPDDGSAVIKGDRAASFTLNGGVNLYGGFGGTETQRYQAAPDEHVTILTGEIWPEQLYWSLHVVTALGGVTIDGVTVTKGNANGDISPFNCGGGILVTDASHYIYINRCKLTENYASSMGGAVYSGYSSSPIIPTKCTFSNNYAHSAGGAIRGTTNATKCTFINNRSGSSDGGAISGTTTAMNCFFTENTSGRAGGAVSGNGTFTNCTFSRNKASSLGGGAVFSYFYSVSFINCKFHENISSEHGGAIFSYNSEAIITATNCTFEKNSASSFGGGISSDRASISVTGCIFTGNIASFGGAIRSANNANSPITVANSTLVNNFSNDVSKRGAAIYSRNTVRIFNSILWHSIQDSQNNLIYVTSTGSLRNADTDFPSPLNVSKNLVKGGMSSVVVEAGGIVSLGDPSVTILTANPLLVNVSTPSGPDGEFGTADDGLRLLPSSPAADQGLLRYLPQDTYDLDQDSDPAEVIPVDLAGFARVQGAALDLGAYEFGGDFPPIVIGSGPESVTVAIGMRAAFSVQATGYSLRYQWYLGEFGDVSQPVTDATDATFTTDPLLATTRFWVRVSNGAGFVDSQPATASVVPVKIKSQPQSQMTAIGSTVNLSVVAEGVGLGYQWYRGTSGDRSLPQTGANSPTFHTGILTEDAAFWVEVTGLHGSAASDTAVISTTEDLLAAALFAGSNLFYTTSGNAEWFVQSDVTYSGGQAIQSGPITHSQSTWVETTLNTAGTLTFWWRVSSQSGGDFLRFYINGVEQSKSIYGTTGNWAQRTITVTTDGPHVFRWAYTKNSSTSTGSDCGWLDEVKWTPKLIQTQPASDNILAGTSAHMAVAAMGSGLSYQWYEGESGVLTDPILGATEPNLTTGVLSENRNYWVKVGNGVGFEYSAMAQIDVYPPIAEIAATLESGAGIGFFTWGDQPWVSQTTTKLNGSAAMQSGAIDHDQASVLEAVVNGPGQLGFWWKVSSELGYDFLSFSIDGVQQSTISGEVDWHEAGFAISGSGSHRLQWKYRKDESKTSGSDLGWLDTVSWTPDVSTMTYLSWASTHGLTGDDALKTASPAKDGVSNLMKYALGLDPHELALAATDGTNPGLPAMEMDGDFMHFVFIKDTAKTDITYTVESCVEFSVWEAVIEGITETTLEGTRARVTVSLPRTTKQFCRLMVVGK